MVREVQQVEILKELDRVETAGKLPEFKLLKYLAENSSTLDNAPHIRVKVWTMLGGRRIIVTNSTHAHRTKNGLAYNGRLGTFDLLEGALRVAIVKRWPKLENGLKEFSTPSYAVHAIGDESSHVVRVIAKVKNHRTCGGVVCKGVDTFQTTLRAMCLIYHWVLWRLLRREKGCNRRRKAT